MSGAEFNDRFAAVFQDACPETKAIFDRIAATQKITTHNAAVLRIEADDSQIHGMTIQNTYNCDRPDLAEPPAPMTAAGQFSHGQHQAVALHAASADRLILRDLRLRSFQDTLYLQSTNRHHPGRILLERCEIEGDVDFIFGQATAYFQDCTIRSLGVRTATSWVTAPSTHIRAPFGFVFEGCVFTHDNSPAALRGEMFLGRQWFEGVRATPYGTSPVDGYVCALGARSVYTPPTGQISLDTLESVGKCVILNSRIGAHISATCPWGEWGGGTRDMTPGADGTAWSPRYRPIQTCATDFQFLLKDWLMSQGLDYRDLDPAAPWLGTFGCQLEPIVP